jgi:hypothetical protein
MAYSPLNIQVYAAAFAGAMAGLGIPGGAFIIDPLTADYAPIATVAAAFAQAVDTVWGAARQPNVYDIGCITDAASNLFVRGAGFPITTQLAQQSNWTVSATALVAMVQQGDTNASALQGLNFPSGGGSNRAYGQGGATTAGQATITVVAAMKLIAKSSGLFKAWFNLSWAGLTAADVATMTVKVFTDAVPGTPLTLANVGAVGFGSNGNAQPGNVAVNNNGPFTANAGAGIVPAGASAGYTDDTKSFTEGTAAVGAILSWENIVGLAAPAAGVETPIPVGQTCLVTLSLTNSVAARATGNISLGMFEL